MGRQLNECLVDSRYDAREVVSLVFLSENVSPTSAFKVARTRLVTVERYVFYNTIDMFQVIMSTAEFYFVIY